MTFQELDNSLAVLLRDMNRRNTATEMLGMSCEVFSSRVVVSHVIHHVGITRVWKRVGVVGWIAGSLGLDGVIKKLFGLACEIPFLLDHWSCFRWTSSSSLSIED